MHGAGTRVAERVQESGATLLLGEFFEVHVKEDGRQAETETCQAMEFCDAEEGVTVKGMCHNMLQRASCWDVGACRAGGMHVTSSNPPPMRTCCCATGPLN